jgi:catechol 2,3-dioxygenase-like lactoylglutathione lyase family enzyme
MPKIQGVLETSLYVENLQRSRAFYQSLFEMEILAADERFSALSVIGKQVLLLFRKAASLSPVHTPNGTIPPHDGSGETHLAFAISSEDLQPWERRLREKDIAIESKVTWERGGCSIYFRDPDGHLLELATPGIWAIY